jgi:hypothetical protein
LQLPLQGGQTLPLMPTCGSENPTSLTNPFMTHVNAAFRWFGFITFITSSEFVNGLIAA